MMEHVLGKIPDRLVRQMRYVNSYLANTFVLFSDIFFLVISRHHQSKYFRGSRLLNFPNDDTTKQSRKYVKSLRSLNVSEFVIFKF